MPRYRIYGLTVESEFPLSALPGGTGEPDLVLSLAPPRSIPDSPSDGVLVSSLFLGTRFGQSLVQSSDGKMIFRFHGTAEFSWNSGTTVVECCLAPGKPTDWASILAASSFLSLWLVLAGRAPIHASAITNGVSAIAFAGHSHQGKSTLAHAAWRGGATILSDDVLLTELSNGVPYALAGSLQIRMRSEAPTLESHLPSRSVDERHCFAFNDAPERVPLSAIIVPRINRESSEVRLERLDGALAFSEIAQYPRGLGRDRPEAKLQIFRSTATLASLVKVFRAHLPYGIQKDPAFPALVAGWLDSTNGI